MGLVWFVVVAVVVAGYVIAYFRKGSAVSAMIGSRKIEFFTPGDVESVYARLSVMQVGKFSIDDKDPDKKIIVLSSPITLVTWGFMYPVFMHPAGTGTRIEIGIQSKFFQLGPLVTRAHKECEAAVRSALGVPEARVA